MPDGLLLTGAGLLALVVLAVMIVRDDRYTGRSWRPDWRGWLLLAVGAVSVVAGAALFWSGLFSR